MPFAAHRNDEVRRHKCPCLDMRMTLLEHAEIVAAGRRGPADEVEDLAVLHAVFGEPLDLAVLVEIDRDHALVGDFWSA